MIVRQLLASSTEEIVNKIGCLPGGDLALRRALATDREAATVYCLVMISESRPVHISIHGGDAGAEALRDAVLASADPGESFTWSIAERFPGSGTRGSITSGYFAG